MDKEREHITEKIEMAKHIAKQYCKPDGCWDCEFWNDDIEHNACCEFGFPLYIAEELQKSGYGDTKQAVREFAERLKEVFNTKHYAVFANAANKEVDELLAEVTGE